MHSLSNTIWQPEVVELFLHKETLGFTRVALAILYQHKMFHQVNMGNLRATQILSSSLH